MKTYTQRLAWLCGVTAALVFLPIQVLLANEYALPPTGYSLIGNLNYTSAWAGETLANIGQRYNVGVNAIMDANPGINRENQLASGAYLTIPSKFILPPLPRRGIVINLAEMRMYYYPEGTDSVMTFPVGIGKVGKTIPTGNTAITRKVVNPTWIPPKDIREFNQEQGIELPYAMGPGPDNPLGPYAIYLKVPTFLIHSTIFPESIGRRASFGCIRMHETDIKQFFPLVQPGTSVAIVNMPSKVGWYGSALYLESHPALEEHGDGGMSAVVSAIEAATRGTHTIIDWPMVSYVATQRDGVPHEIGTRVR
jgi:L,D-transpeptidase ErfK/SrfK